MDLNFLCFGTCLTVFTLFLIDNPRVIFSANIINTGCLYTMNYLAQVRTSLFIMKDKEKFICSKLRAAFPKC